MNDVLIPADDRRSRMISLLRNTLWSVASQVALGGLYTGPLSRSWIRVERRDMVLRGLGGGLDGARLAHITDLHCSTIVRDGYLRRYVDAINQMDVDFVAITGDFITTAQQHFARRVASVLAGLRPRIATVACLGNHDYGIWNPSKPGGRPGIADYVSRQLTQAGVTVLRNQWLTITRGSSTVQFAGLEDFWSLAYNARAALKLLRPDQPIIALCHNPDAAHELARRGAQWVLAGHTHGKSDIFCPTLLKDFVGGHYPLGNGGNLYVSRGIGHSRRSSQDRPEITLFTLRN